MTRFSFVGSRSVVRMILLMVLILSGWAGWKGYGYSRGIRWQGEAEACRYARPEQFPLRDCVVRLRLDNLKGDWGWTLAVGLRRYYHENEHLSCYVQYGWLPDPKTILIYTMANCGDRIAMAQRFVRDYNARYNTPTLSVDPDQDIAQEDYEAIPYDMIWSMHEGPRAE